MLSFRRYCVKKPRKAKKTPEDGKNKVLWRVGSTFLALNIEELTALVYNKLSKFKENLNDVK